MYCLNNALPEPSSSEFITADTAPLAEKAPVTDTIPSETDKAPLIVKPEKVTDEPEVTNDGTFVIRSHGTVQPLVMSPEVA